jgi:CHAD domain-containing protein
LQKRWDLYREQLRSCQEGFSEETVHQLRVATRRLIAQLAMIEAVTPGETAQRVRRILKRRLKALGDLRDTHVLRLFIERRLERYPELTVVWNSLQRREHRMEKSVAAEVQGFKSRKLGRWISGVSLRLGLDPAEARGPQRMASGVEQATAQAFAEVVKRRRAIDPSHPGTIHRTRIAFKKFRYMVESLSPEFTGLAKSDLRALGRYQRRMGIIQDLEVMQQCITDYVREHDGMEESLRPFSRYLQDSRARKLRSFLNSADDVFCFWPPSRVKANGHMGAALHAA